jgi:ketosteroid isomerase-like protein
MQKLISVVAAMLVFSICLIAQPQSDSSYIVQLNQQIDDKVVSRNVASLDSLYTDDFIMTHGDGRQDKKTAWMASVAKSNYSVRRHDSVKVELHTNIAIVKGRMLVQKTGGETTAVPLRSYIRVFAIRNNRWQLLSHYTMYDK